VTAWYQHLGNGAYRVIGAIARPALPPRTVRDPRQETASDRDGWPLDPDGYHVDGTHESEQ
jgi:hypothetical protein